MLGDGGERSLEYFLPASKNEAEHLFLYKREIGYFEMLGFFVLLFVCFFSRLFYIFEGKKILKVNIYSFCSFGIFNDLK